MWSNPRSAVTSFFFGLGVVEACVSADRDVRLYTEGACVSISKRRMPLRREMGLNGLLFDLGWTSRFLGLRLLNYVFGLRS